MTRRPHASVLILLGVLLALLWLAPQVPLLGFAALLLAVALRLPAGWVARHTGMRRWAAVLGVVVGIVALLGLAGWLASGPLAEEANQLAQDLPRSLVELRERMQDTQIGAWLSDRIAAELPGAAKDTAGSAAAVATGTLGALGNFVLILLIGIYLAVRPQDYLAGLRALLDPSLDGKVRATLDECGTVLRGWLLGQSVGMAFVGTVTWLGLMLLGVPLAGVLGAIAGLLNFIPFIGPLIAAVPAMLLAMTQQPMMALWVALLFLAAQTVEGDVLTPMVQSRSAVLPPAVLLLTQVLMGTLFGLLGVALAAPLAAVGLVVVRRAYVEGWLGRDTEAES